MLHPTNTDILDKTTTQLLDGLSCLSNASDLLLDGMDVFDPQIMHWLVAAAYDLMLANVDHELEEIRNELAAARVMIEHRDPRTAAFVNPTALDLLHHKLGILFRLHFRFTMPIDGEIESNELNKTA